MDQAKRNATTAAVCLSITLATAGMVRAQATEAAAPPQQVAVSPEALPGDRHTSSIERQLSVSMGPPAGTPAQPAKEIEKPSLTFDLALEAATAALQSCLADGYPSAVAVTDELGQIRVGFSADGVIPGRTYTAVRKALAAIAFKVPTSALRSKFAEDPSLLAQVKPNMSVLPGALPLMVGDRVVGAIAVSGVMGYEEEKCAGDGVARIQARLK